MKHGNLRETHCPHCGATMHAFDRATELCDIAWDAAKKQFNVKLRMDVCRSCRRSDYPGYEESKFIPAVIAQESVCSCGAPMLLGDHRIAVEGAKISFEGQYICSACGTARNTVIAKIAEGLRSFWSTTKRIEIGPKGVSYEKESK